MHQIRKKLIGVCMLYDSDNKKKTALHLGERSAHLWYLVSFRRVFRIFSSPGESSIMYDARILRIFAHVSAKAAYFSQLP